MKKRKEEINIDSAEENADSDENIEINEEVLAVVNIGTEAEMLLPYVCKSLALTSPQTQILEKRIRAFSLTLRQPRKDDRSCNKTPFFKRWDLDLQQSYLTTSDPRYALQPECQNICAVVLALLLEASGASDIEPIAFSKAEEILGRKVTPNSLTCVHTGEVITANDIRCALSYATQRLGAYEIPLSYVVSLNEGGAHLHSNVGWMKPLHINYKLRGILKQHLEKEGVPRKAAKNILDKIQVKSYCTDKVTMPPHFSNRDFRWATWPTSIQYASHYQCAMMEMELMVQLYEFEDAPHLEPDLISDVKAEIESIRKKPINPGQRKCFVTGKLLNFKDYVEAAKNPKGGRSKYHVGHIMPLTRGGKHTWTNIAWVSDDGNRIQGNDTVEEIEAKLVTAVEYHIRRDMQLPELSSTFMNKVHRLWSLLNEIREVTGKPKFPWDNS